MIRQWSIGVASCALLLVVGACDSKKPPASGSTPPPEEPPVAEPEPEPEPDEPAGEACGEQTCVPPQQCLTYYGIAGASGPEFKTCEIPCSAAKGGCPDGMECVTIADGPGSVCRAPGGGS